MPVIKVLIVDQHTILREALKAILSTEEDVEVAGETFSLDEAASIVSETSPDVVFLNFLEPQMFGASLIKLARKAKQAPGFIAFVEPGTLEAARAFFDMKAAGLLSLDVGPEEVKLAVRRVAAGDTYIDARIAQTLFEAKPNGQKELKLSFRQLQILKMIADGFTNKRISAELGISQDTVKTHVRIILKKLKAADRAQAVSKAYELDIL